MNHLRQTPISCTRFLTGALLVTALIIGMTSCNGSGNKPIKTSVDSVSATGPAPDNNSANNPSSADTNYQKDTGRRISDTPRR